MPLFQVRVEYVFLAYSEKKDINNDSRFGVILQDAIRDEAPRSVNAGRVVGVSPSLGDVFPWGGDGERTCSQILADEAKAQKEPT